MERLYQIVSTTTKQCCGVTSEFAKKSGKKVAVMGAVTLLASGVVSAQIQSGPDPRGPRPNIEGRLSNLENIVGTDGTTNPPAYTLTNKVKELSTKVQSLEADKKEAEKKNRK